MNFRSRTALTIAVLTALALGGAFTAVSAAFNGLQRRQLDASLRAIAAQEAAEAPKNHLSFSEGPGPAANDVGPLTKYGVIYDERGRVVSATPPFDVNPPPLARFAANRDRAFDLRFQGNHLRAIVLPIPGHPGKRLLLATSRDDLDGDEAFLFRAMLVAFLVAVAWASAVAFWMSGRLTSTHRALADVVRTLAGGDLNARVSVKPSDPEVAQLGRDINELAVRLGELLASHERFIAYAAHELRSPLAALYGELQQALRRERDSEGYRQAIEVALSASRDLKLLAEDLLTLARSRAETAAPTARVRAEQVIAAARDMVGALAQKRGVRIVVKGEMERELPDRNGDTARLLRNLLENAIRHSPSGDVVSVSVEHDAGKLLLAVADGGAGVEPGERAAIFEPFYRSRGASSSEGSGLGLGIAREIARSHGGDVTLDTSWSRPGARFVIQLPSV